MSNFKKNFSLEERRHKSEEIGLRLDYLEKHLGETFDKINDLYKPNTDVKKKAVKALDYVTELRQLNWLENRKCEE